MGTGHHAAIGAGVAPGSTVAVVGDGAVGLCGVLAAKRLGAERIIAMGRHEDRAKIASLFGATDQVAERGDAAIERIKEMTGGLGASAVLECVGTEQSWETAMGIVRDGGRIGYVGVPHEMKGLPLGKLFGRNIAIGGGVAPVRAYLPELLADVLMRPHRPRSRVRPDGLARRRRAGLPGDGREDRPEGHRAAVVST